VHANYGEFDYDTGSPISADRDGYGLSAAYDFGGGLSAHIGYGYGETGGRTCGQHLVARPEHVLLIQPDQSEWRERATCPLFSFWVNGTFCIPD
jgi:hypothetical protein